MNNLKDDHNLKSYHDALARRTTIMLLLVLAAELLLGYLLLP